MPINTLAISLTPIPDFKLGPLCRLNTASNASDYGSLGAKRETTSLLVESTLSDACQSRPTALFEAADNFGNTAFCGRTRRVFQFPRTYSGLGKEKTFKAATPVEYLKLLLESCPR